MNYRVWSSDAEPEDGIVIDAHTMEEAAERFAREQDRRWADYRPQREVFLCPWPVMNPLRTCKFKVTLDSAPSYSAERIAF